MKAPLAHLLKGGVKNVAIAQVNLHGKTALVTGATRGMGKEAATALAMADAEVVLVSRNRALCESAAEEIRRDTGNQNVSYLIADLSSQADVRRVAAEFLASGQSLHILLNNAGALFPRFQESADGIEMTWALNHLGYFLLTNLLLDRIRDSAPARIVNVASAAHRRARGLKFDDLEFRRHYWGYEAYSQSKLANILFTRELARRLRGSTVTVNALHPGFVASNFGRSGFIYTAALSLMRPFQVSVAEGARTAIYLCTAPEVAAISGEYFVDCKIAEPSKYAMDGAAAQRLWEISERYVNAAH